MPIKSCSLLVIVSCFAGCTDAQILPAPSNAWFRAGPEAQIILKRRLHMNLEAKGAALHSDFLVHRLLRQGTSLTLRIPAGPETEILAIAAHWISLDGRSRSFGRADFIAVDRLDKPLAAGRQPAYFAAKISVPDSSLLRLRWQTRQRRPVLLPRLDLSDGFPIDSAEIRVQGQGFKELELRSRKLPEGRLQSGDSLLGLWRDLQPASAHPYAPGELGQRLAWLRWKKPKHPGLIARLVADPKANYQLRTLPTAGASEHSTACLLRPWGAEVLRPQSAILSTVTQLAEGGYKLNLPDAFRRPFRDCTLIQPGALARVVVPQPGGSRVLRVRSRISAEGHLLGQGQLIYSGAAAQSLRRAEFDMNHELRALLAPVASGLVLGKAQRGGSGPIYLPFKLSIKVEQLDPSRWLTCPFSRLSYLQQGLTLGPTINERRIEWVFDWPAGANVPPPTRMASVGRGPVSASVTWSLGPQRTLRFVRSATWRREVFMVDTTALKAALKQLVIPAIALPKP